MSLTLRGLLEKSKKINQTRDQILALHPDLKYDDGRTLQSHKDETDIVKIMARFEKTGTISHLAKHEGSYADFSDFDFFTQTQKLTRGREIFDDLPAELRKEFGQSPAAFFAYVNDPANIDELREKLPGLAAPGRQLPATVLPLADQATDVAVSEDTSETPPLAETPPDSAIKSEK